MSAFSLSIFFQTLLYVSYVEILNVEFEKANFVLIIKGV